MNAQSFFQAHPVFRYEEFASFMKERGVSRPGSCWQQLYYHHKVGHIVRVRRALYAVRSVFMPEGGVIDPYLIAGKVTPDGVIAYHTALELHGLAHTILNKLTILTESQIQSFVFEGRQFRPVMPLKALIRSKNTDYEVITINRLGQEIKLTSAERTLVDVLDRPGLAGGWKEIGYSLDKVAQLDINKMVDYALLLKNSITVAKLGFFLEQRVEQLAVNQDQLERLLFYIPKQSFYLDRAAPGKRKYIKKWQIIIPDYLQNEKYYSE